MAKVYHIETSRPGFRAPVERVAKSRCCRIDGAHFSLHSHVYEAAKAQALLDTRAAWDALRAAYAFRPERGDNRILEILVGDYLVTAQRVDA